MTFASSPLWAQHEHQVLRKLAVFPIAHAEVSSAEEAWWQARETLTKDQRFFVASRRFMVNRGVFQARENLTPADAIILAKILDAEALVTLTVEERTLSMQVFDGGLGFKLWTGKIQLHPAIQIKDQLVSAAGKLVMDFISAIPYQGYQVKDQTLGKDLMERNEQSFARIFIGGQSEIKSGDPVQWIRLVGETSRVFFAEGAQVQILAEGIVSEVNGDLALVEVKKMRSVSDLTEFSLVRFPKEMERLKESYSLVEVESKLATEYLAADYQKDSSTKKHNKTSASLTWILSLAAVILLAF
jgi:hypothetical protein